MPHRNVDGWIETGRPVRVPWLPGHGLTDKILGGIAVGFMFIWSLAFLAASVMIPVWLIFLR
jgi:hypothetical protein